MPVLKSPLFYCLLLLGSTSAEVLAAESLSIPRVTPAIVVDAELNEPQWQQAREMPILYNTWPAENTPAPVKTMARVMEDGEFFYISFVAEDPDPSQIRAYYRDRDKMWDDDSIGIKLDTYDDSKLAYQFFVNALGVQGDAIENEITKTESDAWDGIWQSAGKITATGYQIEVAIPLRLLNFNDRLDLQRWKLELLRFYPRDVRHRLSTNKILREDPCWICQMQTVEGFRGARQGNHFTLVPSLVMGVEQQRDVTPQGNSDWQSDRNIEPSLDVKWGITPDISLNATLNPDFSQIEADEAQVSMNDTFALFFDEKRPFFLDNADYFSSPLDLVYTRNVSSPDAGLKLTGRVDQQSFAVFAANDKDTTFIIPGNISSDLGYINAKSDNAVLRYRYDLNPKLSLGWISTLRSSDDYHNYVHGLDLKYQATAQDKVVAQLLHSDSAYPQQLAAQFDGEAKLRLGEDLSGVGQFLAYEHESRSFTWYSRYLGYSDGFRADMGYMPQTDWNKYVHGAGYQWFSDSQWWNNIELRGDWDISHSQAGELLEKEAEAELIVHGPLQSELSLMLTERDRVGSRLDGSRLVVDANTALFTEHTIGTYALVQPWSGVYIEVESEFGDKLDFRNNRLGDGLEIAPEIRWNANMHAQVALRHTYRTLDADDAEVFTANLTDLRLSYQFSVRSFVRLALIYSDIRQNPANNLGPVTEQSEDLGMQLLYSYKLNPQTLFFAGYSDHAYSDDEIQQLTRDDRSVFLKFSYAWML
ncbi:DUF5916 domain-containing protein [Rheinheimera texasensis]|uniref:carbohydrate binding family 9 domain-containing protein n=1 Tax=Rheinheimera texasensis TaxID=306205 RepID=UPI0032B1A262